MEEKKDETSISIEDKTLVHQLEQNLLILEQDFNAMLIKIQKGMNQLSNNNALLSDIYKKAIEEYCDSITNAEIIFLRITNNCENLQDHFLQIDILSKKIALFRDICEEKIKKIEKNNEILA